jgi:hypothetical protein
MPPALRLGANPPFQRVEETIGAYKKARLFGILREFCCDATKKQIGIPKKDNTNLFVKLMMWLLAQHLGCVLSVVPHQGLGFTKSLTSFS